jgi:FdhE protein
MITARTFSPVCRCCRVPMSPWISNRAAEWRQRLSNDWPPEPRRDGSRRRPALDTELRREPQVSRRIADFLLGDETLAPPFPGLLRYLAWTAIARFLRPVVNAFDGWRDEVRWLRRYCPTCGSLPAMAQLVGVDAGRMRLLSCGCCGTRWQFQRTGCPFCETDSQRLASVTIEGERGLRIDHCESCGGYLKTYDGQGNETLLLSDWSSLHLDLIAHDR